jgi:hypothetical protein
MTKNPKKILDHVLKLRKKFQKHIFACLKI